MRNPIKRAIRQSNQLYRLGTSRMRALPDFIIIGAMKAGTGFLYRYLVAHPNVKPARRKEIHYFDLKFKKGINWYRSQFPLLTNTTIRGRKQLCITGEASPYYMFHPHAPRRISAIIPQVKLIVLLRNPIDRAYSHYQHAVRVKCETMSFEKAIEIEAERLHGKIDKMLEDEHYYSFNHQAFSYLARGVYIDQLRILTKFFEGSQILILKSEELFSDQSGIFKCVLDFLSLPRWEPEKFRPIHQGQYPEMSPVTRKRLCDYFEPHNQRLYSYLGTDFGWEK